MPVSAPVDSRRSWLAAWDAQGITAPRPRATMPARTGWPPRPPRSAPMSRSRNSRSTGSTRSTALSRDRRRRGSRRSRPSTRRRPTRRASTGRLGPVGSDAEIAVAELPPQAVYSGEYERLRRARRASRLCHPVRRASSPGMGAAQRRAVPRSPYGTPAIHVSSEARDGARRRGAGRSGPARRATAAAPRRTARNVVVTLAGTRRRRPRRLSS